MSAAGSGIATPTLASDPLSTEATSWRAKGGKDMWGLEKSRCARAPCDFTGCTRAFYRVRAARARSALSELSASSGSALSAFEDAGGESGDVWGTGPQAGIEQGIRRLGGGVG